jgi:hypothetical protein
MITVSSPVLVGGVQVATTAARGWSADELAARAADKIIYVGDKSHPAVQAQARAFKESVHNDINAIRNMGMVPQGYVVNNFLTDPDAFFIKTDAPNGMKMFERVSMKTGFEGDFDTGNVRYKARERYSFGFSDPRGMFGSPGSA